MTDLSLHALPEAGTEERYEALGEEQLRPAVLALCTELGLPTERLTRFPTGSLPVYAIGDKRVLKLYPPVHADELPVERATLEALYGQLPLPTPGVHAAGLADGWGYLVMDRLYGESLAEAWPRLPAERRLSLVRELGRALARLHAVPAPAEVGPDADGWRRLLADQRAGCVAAQRRLGLSEEWLARIPAFLDPVPLPEAGDGAGEDERVLLHTEFMAVHVLVEEVPGEGWQLSGLLDFEPAMRGAREYDLVAVGIFVTRGDPALMRAFLDGYGYDPAARAALPRRVMAYTLLHVQCHLPWFLREVAPEGARDFEQLAERWFGSGDGSGGDEG